MLARVRKSGIGIALLLGVKAVSAEGAIAVVSFLLVCHLCAVGDHLLMLMRGGITPSSLSRRGSFSGTLFRLWLHSRVVFDVGVLMGFEVQNVIEVLRSEASAKLSMCSSSEKMKSLVAYH